ncbi:hypothetical protein [uncultured Photobacterium sp.]|uniref:hypothetical protein n=1 Tax=uncultured Photobacterium sp. TaxID=173973 RepID=UPI002636C263|nr:hypothetical protein [uncultured Photobacterium sp.]
MDINWLKDRILLLLTGVICSLLVLVSWRYFGDYIHVMLLALAAYVSIRDLIKKQRVIISLTVLCLIVTSLISPYISMWFGS